MKAFAIEVSNVFIQLKISIHNIFKIFAEKLFDNQLMKNLFH